MKDVTWQITKINETQGEIFVKFTDDINVFKKVYKWNGDQDILIQNINNDAIIFAQNWNQTNPIVLSTKIELLNSSGSSNTALIAEKVNNINVVGDIFYFANSSDTSTPVNV